MAQKKKTRVAFVHGGFESLGIEYISAVLKEAGYETILAFDPKFLGLPNVVRKIYNFKDRAAEEIRKSGAGIAAFSVMTDDYAWACDVARHLKKEIPGLFIVFGGIHPTSVPEKVIEEEFVDAVCMGEGEYQMLELVNRIESGKDLRKLPGFLIKDGGRVYSNGVPPLDDNLDSMPLPDKDLFYSRAPMMAKHYFIMTSRGCMFACTYCCHSVLKRLYPGKGKLIRRRSIENVIAELKWAKKSYNPKSIHFYDDIFTFDKGWLKPFLARYRKEIGLPFYCIAHTNALDRDIISWLKEAGCDLVEIGVQSVIEKTRKDLLRRHETNEQIEKAASLLNEFGIPFFVDHIAGLPYENEADLAEAVRFYNRIRPTNVSFNWLTYYPGTEIIKKGLECGDITEKDIEMINKGLGDSLQCGGSVKEAYRKKTIEFQAIFNLWQFLPRGAVNFMIEKRALRFLPLALMKPLRFLRMSLNKSSLDYLGYYISCLMK